MNGVITLVAATARSRQPRITASTTSSVVRIAGSNSRAASSVGFVVAAATTSATSATTNGPPSSSAHFQRPAARWPRPGNRALSRMKRGAFDGGSSGGPDGGASAGRDGSDIAGKDAVDRRMPQPATSVRAGRAFRYRQAVTVETLPHRQDWRIPVAAFWVTQLVESLGVSQVFALLPAYLRQLGVPEADRIAFVGLYSSLVFVVGLPLVPLWGVWADKYSRKAVIVRSALVEAVVFALAALAREPWQMAVAVLLIGFQLGNTGVMLAAIRDVTPKHRLGTTIGLFGAAGPIGFALGPVLAGILIDGAGWSISGVYALSAVLSVGTALLITFGTHEIRPEVIPEGSVIRLAFAAMRSVLADPVVRRLFLVYGVVFLANQVSRPYTPVLVEAIVGNGTGPGGGHRHRAGGRLARRGVLRAGRRLGRRPHRVPAGAGRGAGRAAASRAC